MVYGGCFVLGFAMAYFLLSWIFKHHFLNSSVLLARDVASWPTLAKLVVSAANKPENPLYTVYQKLNRSMQQELTDLKYMQELNAEQKEALLSGINALQLDRSYLEKHLPKALTTAKEIGFLLTDKMTWFVVLGILIGARLGHVLFYDLPRYQHHLWDVFKVWEGGLASHGGVLGLLLALFIFYRLVLKNYPEISWVGLIDYIAIPAGLIAFWIRVGNFFNQEIIGPETNLPWAVIFGDPYEGTAWVPRHPTQLYEAGVYFSVFAILLSLWIAKRRFRPGILSGLCLILIFGSRFLIEFIKLPQSMIIDETFLQMGQYLSLPFIVLGLLFYFRGQKLDLLIKNVLRYT